MRAVPLCLVLAAVVAAPARADDAARKAFGEGTRVVVVGAVTSQPRDAGVVVENKMQVAVGPEKRDYTLHIKDAELYGPYGAKLKREDLKDRMWVRAEGVVMDDPRRVRVERLQVIGSDLESFRRSAFGRPGFDQGYAMAVAGTREIFPPSAGVTLMAIPMAIVGRVSDSTGPLETTRKLQVKAAGNEWTLRVNKDAQIVDEGGKKISVHEVAKDQWVRATGWQTDDLRMRVVKIENIGAEQAYRLSKPFRAEMPLGYVERIIGLRTDRQPVMISGTVTSVDMDGGYFTVRDADGKEHGIYAELAEIRQGERGLPFGTLRGGEVVIVRVREIQF